MTVDANLTQIILAVITGLPTVLAVIFAARKQRQQAATIADTQSQERKDVAATQLVAADSLATQVDQVHNMANDRLTKALDRIEALQLQVERLSNPTGSAASKP
jgi:uncharacterized protein YktB (UPF0637 family)